MFLNFSIPSSKSANMISSPSSPSNPRIVHVQSLRINTQNAEAYLNHKIELLKDYALPIMQYT